MQAIENPNPLRIMPERVQGAFAEFLIKHRLCPDCLQNLITKESDIVCSACGLVIDFHTAPAVIPFGDDHYSPGNQLSWGQGIGSTLSERGLWKVLGSSPESNFDLPNSPASDIYHRLYGCEVYKQDMSFADGIYDKVIGGDACRMPIEKGFASKMAMHCSFEHFENDSDIRFIREADRVLRKGGKLCILPLYLFNKYVVQTDPTLFSRNKSLFERGAIMYCARGWAQRHSRFYDVAHLASRIRDNMERLELTIYVVKNEKQADPSCYLKFIALFEKK